MPNWCENIVRVTGPVERVAEFVEFVKGRTHDDIPSSFCFNKIIPVDPILYETNAWHDFCTTHWGTKWEPSGESFFITTDTVPDDGYAEWGFYTAWNPPEGIFEALRSKFSDIDISWFYHEPGLRIAGYL